MFNRKIQGNLYLAFRLLIGFFFFSHGLQKLFGFFGGVDGNGGVVDLFGLMGLAGLIEFIGGLFIFLGLFTSIVASIAALEMLTAYFMVHIPSGGILPLMQNVNGGAAILFFSAFLVLIAFGAGKWSLERKLLGREVWHQKR